jgi:hypothetical protein
MTKYSKLFKKNRTFGEIWRDIGGVWRISIFKKEMKRAPLLNRRSLEGV